MATFLLLLVIGIPVIASAASILLADRHPELLVRLSIAAALALTFIVTLAVVGVRIPMFAGRELEMSPQAQLGIQLLALAMLGLTMSLESEPPESAVEWLPLAWLSLGSLTLSLLVTSLTLAVLALVAAGLFWALGRPAERSGGQTAPLLHYAVLLVLAAPLLLTALRLAEIRTSASPELEPLVLALATPGFGLILSVVPLHTWSVALVAGSPRPMVLGVLGLVQTAGFILLLRTLVDHPWMLQDAQEAMIVAGAVSALIGGWLALSAPLDDADDWLAFLLIANTGFLLAGLGTQQQSAGRGVSLLLFSRVLALVVVGLAPRCQRRLLQAANAFAGLTLAGTPGLAGFPGLWLVVSALGGTGHPVAAVALLAGSGTMFGAALRRWRSEAGAARSRGAPRLGRWPVLALLGLLVLLGLAPDLASSTLGDALRLPFLLPP